MTLPAAGKRPRFECQERSQVLLLLFYTQNVSPGLAACYFLLGDCLLGRLGEGGPARFLQASTRRSSESPSGMWLFCSAVLCFRKSPNIDPKQRKLRCFLTLEQAAGLQVISLW